MRKNFIILVVSVVLFSLFNTTGLNFRLWDNPSINSDYINTPSIPISTQTDISIFGLLTNFFSDLTLEYPSNDIVYNEGSSLDYQRYTPKPEEEEVYEPVEEVYEPVEEVYEPVEEDVYEPEPVVKEKEKAPIVVEEVVVDSTAIKDSIAAAEEAELERQLKEAEEALIRAKKEEELERKRAAKREERRLAAKRQSIIDNASIKENAKELILESIDAGIITFEDIDQLLLETSPKDVKKRQVKKLIKSKS